MFRDVKDALARKLRIDDAGGTTLPVGSLVDKDEIREANALAEAEGKPACKTQTPRPATAKTLLLGVTKAALQTESFLANASFQETTKVLTEAALGGKIDALRGLAENVLLGRIIPAGTGFEAYSKAKVKRLVEEADSVEMATARMLEDTNYRSMLQETESGLNVAATLADESANEELRDANPLGSLDERDTSRPHASIEYFERFASSLEDAGFEVTREPRYYRLNVYDDATELMPSVFPLSDGWLSFSGELRFKLQTSDAMKRAVTEDLNKAEDANFMLSETGGLLVLARIPLASNMSAAELMRAFRKFLGVWRSARDGPRYRNLFDETS
jgi:hypothetical protein